MFGFGSDDVIFVTRLCINRQQKVNSVPKIATNEQITRMSDEKWKFEKETVNIGRKREENDIILKPGWVSREHVTVTRQNGGAIVTDRSKVGTLLIRHDQPQMESQLVHKGNEETGASFQLVIKSSAPYPQFHFWFSIE